MLSVKDIHKRYGNRSVLDGVSFELRQGSITGLIGPSGGGKSTLLKIMAGVTRADSGVVDMGGCGPDEIGLMFQEGALFDSLTVYDNIAFHLVHGRVPCATLPKEERAAVHEKVQSILARVGLSAAAQKVPGQLSGGMRRRVSLARALVSRPQLALLDDPTAGLDPVASSIIMNFIVEIHAEYRPTMLIASHDLRRLLPVCETTIALMNGSVRFHGTLEDLRNQECSDLSNFVSARYNLNPTRNAAAHR